MGLPSGTERIEVDLDFSLGRHLLSGPVREELKAKGLTATETRVLEKMCDGKGNRQIGAELFLAEKTIKFHITYINRKLRTKSRTEAMALVTKLWIRLGSDLVFDDLHL